MDLFPVTAVNLHFALMFEKLMVSNEDESEIICTQSAIHFLKLTYKRVVGTVVLHYKWKGGSVGLLEPVKKRK